MTIELPSGPALGVRVSGGFLNVAAASRMLNLKAPAEVQGAMAAGALENLRRLAEAAAGRPEIILSPEAVRLGPCVTQPQKLLCVGLNYRRHADELKMAYPASPVLFSKFNNALAGDGAEIRLPDGAAHYDYEAELAMVIGRRARDVGEAEALDYVVGYCTANDLSARDLQFRTTQWLLGKTCDGFCPLGPELVTADEVKDPDNLGIRTWVNGELRQDSNTSDMIFSCRQLISYISRYITLEPGDVILTGTPAGVISGRPEDQRVWLKAGDLVSVEVEGLGRLSNRLVQGTKAARP